MSTHSDSFSPTNKVRHGEDNAPNKPLTLSPLSLRLVRRLNLQNMNWKIEYYNDTGPDDGGFWEWWAVSNGTRSFKCDDEADAKWLAELLNAQMGSA